MGASSRQFAYTGKPGTCLWCGRKFREIYFETGGPPPAVGSTYQDTTRTVRAVVGVIRTPAVRDADGYITNTTRRERPVRDGETPTRYRIYFDPPVWNAYYRDTPWFDTVGCAASFGLRQAELGFTLRLKTNQ
jgi:hypothetical protein